MSLILIILLILIIVVGLIFAFAMNIKLLVDTAENQYNISFQWIYPFLEVEFELDNLKPMVTVFIFEKKVYRKAVKIKNKKKNSGLIKAVKLNDVEITASYGFKNPALTGVLCGVVNIINSFIPASTLQTPNFVTTNDYIRVDGVAKLNLGTTIVNLAKKS